jgi:bacillithiol system protein YtxJ
MGVKIMKTRVSTIEDFEKVMKDTPDFLLIKHSLTCPISSSAFEEYGQFVKDNPDIQAFYLYVQEDRPLSNYIAETYGIKHESPQALYIKNGDVVWNASHWKITNSSLTNVVL